jgi:hypothetical protein
MSGHLLQYLRGVKTTVEGDTLECVADNLKTKAVQATGTVAVTGGITATTTIAATGALTGASVNDAGGQIHARRYVWQSAVVDISAGAATQVGPIMPSAGQLIKAYWVCAEAFAAGMATGAIKVGYVDADGSSNGVVDAFVVGTTDGDHGLLVAPGATGRVQELTLASQSIPAGKALTITHVQQAVAGTVYVILEYAIL